MADMFPGVAVVTGAAGTGMGQAIAKSFAREGCKHIAITDINAQLLDVTKREIQEAFPGVEVHAQAGDIADDKFVEAFFDVVKQKFGSINYAVNCAGIMGNNQNSTSSSISDFDKINSINYRGCWLSSRAELKHMLKQDALTTHDGRPGERGAIVNIASQLGVVGRPNARKYRDSLICSSTDG